MALAQRKCKQNNDVIEAEVRFIKIMSVACFFRYTMFTSLRFSAAFRNMSWMQTLCFFTFVILYRNSPRHIVGSTHTVSNNQWLCGAADFCFPFFFLWIILLCYQWLNYVASNSRMIANELVRARKYHLALFRKCSCMKCILHQFQC
jgi:hypothetical protein